MSVETCRVLMAWEHGRNLGHVSRLTAVAHLLEHSGAALAWALPPGWANAEPFKSGPHLCMPAPRIVSRMPQRAAPARSFADVLASMGFADADALTAAVERWLALFSRLAIDRVVLDYAPAAQLAALLAGLPAVQITNGFDAPPPDCPLFGIGMRGAMLERRNALRVAALNRSIDAAARALGRSGGASLAELLAHPVRWYDCIAQTDPYGPRNDGVYVGPIGRPPEAASVAWPAGCGSAPKVFVYLRDEAHVDAALNALRDIRARTICAWPGAREESLERRRRPGLNLVNRPVNLERILPACDAVINYASTTLVCQTLLAGKPQLMLPTDAEKWMVARRVAQVKGAGYVLDPRIAGARLGDEAGRVLRETIGMNGPASSAVHLTTG